MSALITWLKSNLLIGTLAFGVSFAIPFLAALAIGGSATRKSDSIDISGAEEIFPDSLIVHENGVSYRISDSDALDPTASEDFVLVTWFKLRRSITVGERLIFVGKYDASSRVRPGYSVGFARDGDGTRPVVYWQSSKGRGRWYSFEVADIPARTWNFIAVSFRSGRYLGVHVGSLSTPATQPLRLGGYELEGDVVPNTSSPLVIGAFGGSRFRGRLGPFGIIKAPSVANNLDVFLKELLAQPGKIPQTFGDKAAVLWVNGSKDLSERHNQVEVMTKPSKKDLSVVGPD